MNILPGQQLEGTQEGFLWPFVFIALMFLTLNVQGKQQYKKETFSVHARRPHLYVGRLHGFSLVYMFLV